MIMPTLADYAAVAPPWGQAPVLIGIAGSHAHGTHLPPDDLCVRALRADAI